MADTAITGEHAATIRAADLASKVLRAVLLAVPGAKIDLREKVVRGCYRPVMTVTAKDAYSELGDLTRELYRAPYEVESHRDGEDRIRVYL